MRKGISIIELIFTIVIIALVFTVIPKVVFALKKSDSFAIRQDAILNSISLAKMISKLPWDENNTANADILHVDGGNFTCDPISTYRLGGFVGSRNCENNITASSVGFEGGENEESFDDVDDWNNHEINSSTYYKIATNVSYVNDFSLNLATTQNIDLNLAKTNNRQNLKRVDINTTYTKSGETKEIVNFSYTSANIGQFFIHKRVWQ